MNEPDEKYPQLKEHPDSYRSIAPAVIREWIVSQFPLLNLEFLASYIEATKQRSYLAYLLPENHSNTEKSKVEQSASSRLRKERDKQLQSLIALAESTDSPTDRKAQLALFYIATDADLILGKEILNLDADGYQLKEPVKNVAFAVCAATAIASFLDTGESADTLFSQMIIDGLCSFAPARVRIELLKGLHKITAYGTMPGKSSLQRVIDFELKLKPTEQDRQFQAALIDSLAYYKPEISLELLQSLSAKSVHQEIRKQAEQMIVLLASKRKQD